jgi:hypothetical protein
MILEPLKYVTAILTKVSVISYVRLLTAQHIIREGLVVSIQRGESILNYSIHLNFRARENERVAQSFV